MRFEARGWKVRKGKKDWFLDTLKRFFVVVEETQKVTMRSFTSIPYVPTGKQIKERFTTVKAWELPKQKSALAPEHVWTNEDMDPVKKENQTWTLWTW